MKAKKKSQLSENTTMHHDSIAIYNVFLLNKEQRRRKKIGRYI